MGPLPIDSYSLITNWDAAALHIDSDDSGNDDADDRFETHDSCATDGDRDHCKASASACEKISAKLFELKALKVGDERGTYLYQDATAHESLANLKKVQTLIDRGTVVYEKVSKEDDLDNSSIVQGGRIKVRK